MADDEDLAAALVRALHVAADTGSPVAYSDNEGSGAKMADLSIRRWRSFDRRRRKKSTGSHEEKVEDLARGLVAGFERDPALVGPLFNDYRYVAACLAGVLAEHDAGESVSLPFYGVCSACEHDYRHHPPQADGSYCTDCLASPDRWLGGPGIGPCDERPPTPPVGTQ